jgi:hypothetical protein
MFDTPAGGRAGPVAAVAGRASGALNGPAPWEKQVNDLKPRCT